MKPVVFASGCKSPAEIAGFSAIGHPMGVCADTLSARGEKQLKNLSGTGLPVFVDSGAFSEVAFPKDSPPIVVNPISDAEWCERLELYERLARVLGNQLYIVAPDRVGDQVVTLARMRRYAEDVRRIAGYGANVLAPLQSGAMPPIEFHRAVTEALGIESIIPAFPMKKQPAMNKTILEYISEVQPVRLHLLGLGESNEQVPALLEMIALFSPETQVSMDSVKIRASVGRHGGSNGQPRKLTAARAVVEDSLRECYWSEVGIDDPDGTVQYDYTECIGAPSAWLFSAAKRRIAVEMGMTKEQRRRWYADPDEFMRSSYHDGDNAEDTETILWWEVLDSYHVLDMEWQKHLDHIGGYTRKRNAIIQAFGQDAEDASPDELAA